MTNQPDNVLFPDLYKKSSKGKIQIWSIKYDKNKIIVTHGQRGGKLQTTEEVISEGKNLGKANETTPAEQARLEAAARWDKQVKKGYVTDVTKAEAGSVDETVIEGGINPMLAHKYRDHAAKIEWPCFGQPKLDGIRCIATIKAGKCTLWSRTRKPINSVPHIVAALETRFVGQDAILDGELYNMKYKNDFEHIVHLVRQEEPCEGHEDVQYHIYDIVNSKEFAYRTLDAFDACSWPYVWAVATVPLKDEEEAMEYFEECLKAGYEGIMLRNSHSKYETKRSYNLQKVKEMLDEEFVIVGVEEARGKRAGQAVVVCITKEGKQFKAVPKGTDEFRTRLLKEAKQIVGKQATIQYQNMTKDGIPRFPVMKCVRDFE